MDKGKELGLNYEYDCIKSFVETGNFNRLSAKYELDSKVIVDLCKTFASHVSIPKVKWDKYHEPYKDDKKEKQFSNNAILFALLILFCLLFTLRNHLFLLE